MGIMIVIPETEIENYKRKYSELLSENVKLHKEINKLKNKKEKVIFHEKKSKNQ